MANMHEKKSHDYASRENPFGNYHFAGELALLFAHSPKDAGFLGRLGEKVYRLANLERSGKTPQNESVADTELDICVITALWMASRRQMRANNSGGCGEVPVDPRNQVQEMLPVSERSDIATKRIIDELIYLTPTDVINLADYVRRFSDDAKHMMNVKRLSEDEQKQKSLEMHVIDIANDMNNQTLENSIAYLRAVQDRNNTTKQSTVRQTDR